MSHLRFHGLGADGLVRSMVAASLMLLALGCVGTPTDQERVARQRLEDVSRRYRPGHARPVLPTLTADSTLADLLLYAMLANPSIEAAHYDWAASVERIVGARSLPDPRLTFEADIADMLRSLMPGLMLDLPGPGKLRAAGDAAAGESLVRYFAFEQEVLRTALAVKTAYFRLHFLEETIRVERETARLLADLEQLAQQQNAAGRASLQDVLRAQIEREQIDTQVTNLEDSRSALLAELKVALGLGPGTPAPPVPSRFQPSADRPDADAILATALARNPNLRMADAEVRRAESMLTLARTAGVPDFSLGLEIDFDANPTLLRPTASITLPIWRDKIEAGIAAAQMDKRAAEARLSTEEIRLAAELATLLFAYRESVRNEELLSQRLVPKARQSLEAARAGYVSARASFLDLIDAERALLGFQLSLVRAQTQRELALASLSLVIAGTPPEGAPVLPPPPAPPQEPIADSPDPAGPSPMEIRP